MGSNIKYRVDVASSRSVPCGMNSIKYLGNDWQDARATFAETEAGEDGWNQPNALYGVILSVWDDNKQQYIIKCEKGLKS